MAERDLYEILGVSKTASNAKTVVVTYTIPAAGGAWDPADNGTYTVALAAGAVADGAGNGNNAATLGTFAVSVPDTTAPAASLTASNITAASGGAYTFTVTYADELAIDPATVGAGDVIVTGPGGFSQVATFVSKTSPNGKTVIGTYSITGPGGAWDFADNGSYTVSVQAGQVRDAATNPVAAGAVGGFSVSIAQSDTTAPAAALPAVSTITTSTTAAKTFIVTYTDAGGINLTTLGTGDVPLSEGFIAWRAYVAKNPDLACHKLMARACPHLSEAEAAAYEAPYPDSRSKAGVRRFPQLVPEKPDDPNWRWSKVTPGDRRISMKLWRPFSGISATLIGSKTTPREAVADSISSCAPVTVTSCVMAPTRSCGSLSRFLTSRRLFKG